jgi:hypothetical protein
MACVTAVVDQVFPVADDEVKVTEPPVQNVVGPPAAMIGTLGAAFTVTAVAAELATQPDPFPTVTV